MEESAARSMKIAMIGHKDFPSRDGGVEVVVGELATRMVGLGHRVTVFNRGRIKGVPQVGMVQGVETRRCPAPSKSGLCAVIASITASVEACQLGFDVIHYHAEGPSLALLLPHLKKIPTVATIHGLDWQRSKWGRFARAYLKLGERIAARFADEVIVLSAEMQSYFRKTYGRETILLGNGIRPIPPTGDAVICKAWGLKKDRYLLYLARITPEKGLHYLIEAYRSLDTDLKLVIAGNLTDTDYCARVCELAAGDDRICFVGHVEGELLQALYNNCKLYVLPSELEGMPMTLLEALSAGCRCLVSDIPENVQFAQEYVYTFVNQDVSDLRIKLQDLLTQSVDMARQQKQQTEISAKYNWDSVVEQTLALYTHVQKQR